MGNMGSFFIRYLMQVAFLMNMLYLFDIPHFLIKTVRWWTYKYIKHRRHPKEALERFKDTWYFDLGYFQAYTLTLFFLSLLLAVAIPLTTIFSCVFFGLRYNFDKYNQVFVYFKEFEAKGRLKKHVIYISVVIIMLSQLLNFAFLKLISSLDYMLPLGIVLVCLQIGVIIGMKISQYQNKKLVCGQIALDQMRRSQMNSHMLLKLKAAYRHPWLETRDGIFEYYNQRMRGQQYRGRISDLNIQDDQDFGSLQNL